MFVSFLPVTLPGTNAWLLAITWGKPVFLDCLVFSTQFFALVWVVTHPTAFSLLQFGCVLASFLLTFSVLSLLFSCCFGHFRDHFLLIFACFYVFCSKFWRPPRFCCNFSLFVHFWALIFGVLLLASLFVYLFIVY